MSAPLKSPFVKLYPLISSPGPIICLAVTLYPGGRDAGIPSTLSDLILDKFDPLSFTLDKSTLLKVTPEKFDPVKSTPGPTMYPVIYL